MLVAHAAVAGMKAALASVLLYRVISFWVLVPGGLGRLGAPLPSGTPMGWSQDVEGGGSLGEVAADDR
jgi:hypothetical protein